jgi:drug/metabolite transporter (DMT)-like permease
MPRPPLGYALTVSAAGLFALNGTVSTLALQAGVPAPWLTALRCGGAAVVLLAVLAVVAPARLRVSWREVPFLAAFGVVGIALTQCLYYVAIGRLPVGIALVFEMTAPVFIALWVWLVRGERVRRRLWGALGLSLSGLTLVAEVWTGGGGWTPWAWPRPWRRRCAWPPTTSWGSGARPPATRWRSPAGASSPPGCSGRSPRRSGRSTPRCSARPCRSPSGRSSCRCGTWSAGSSSSGRCCRSGCRWRRCGHLPPTTAGLVATVEPVLASGVAWLWVEQVLSGWQVLGGVVVLTGDRLAQTARTARRPAPVPEPAPAPA